MIETWLLGGTVDADDLKSSILTGIPVRIRKEPPLREDGEMADTGDSKSPAHRELAGSSPALPTSLIISRHATCQKEERTLL